MSKPSSTHPATQAMRQGEQQAKPPTGGAPLHTPPWKEGSPEWLAEMAKRNTAQKPGTY
jgi:hypothetical protein